MSKVFVCTAEGFYVKSVYDGNNPKPIHVFSDRLVEAQVFTSKSAHNFIEKSGVKGFIWKPFEEYHNTDRWEVLKPTWDRITYKVSKVFRHDSDERFLSRRCKKEEYYSEQEAVEIADKENLKLINQIKSKIYDNRIL